MKYKADYEPQYVLDPHSLKWDPLDDAMRDLMSNRKYASMSLELSRRDRGNDVEQSHQQDESLYVEPLEAMEAYVSGASLLDLSVPGVLNANQVREQIDLDTIKIRLNGRTFETQVSRIL
jgi:arginine-tRNA-protein transferase